MKQAFDAAFATSSRAFAPRTFSLPSIHPAGVCHFVAQLADAGESPKSVNNILVFLKTIRKSVVEDGEIPSNPAAVVKRLKCGRREMSFLIRCGEVPPRGFA